MRKDSYRSIEIIAVILTIAAKIVRDICLNQETGGSTTAATIIGAVVIGFWLVYLACRMIATKGEIIKDWGFTTRNFKPAMKWVGIVGALAVCGFVAYGLVVQHTRFSLNILWSVLVYPFWGLAQQLLFISLVAGNLEQCEKRTFNEFQILAITAILFCLVHYPNPCLMIVTFFMAIFFAMMFLKYRNIYPLAIFHGVVGAVFYYFVLNDDPWADMIAAICTKICA